MANNAPNLKVNVGADTSQFSAEMKKAKSDLKAFDREANDAVSGLANAFGVPIDRIKRMSSALSGAAAQAEKTGSKGAGALKAIAGAASGAGVAIAGLGLGAAVTAFKLLSAEAENFKSTWQGMELNAGLEAFLDTYRQAFHDLNAEIGKNTAVTGANLKKTWVSIWTGLKDTALNVLTGGKGFGEAFAETLAKGDAAKALANQAAEYARQMTAARKAWIGEGIGTGKEGKSAQVARLTAQIAEARLGATEGSTSEMLSSIDRAAELINQKYAIQIEYQTKIADLTRKIANLASSTPEQMQAAANEEEKLMQLQQQHAMELMQLNRRKTALANQAAKEAAAAAKTEADNIQQMLDTTLADLSVELDAELDADAEALLNEVVAGLDLAPVTLPINPELNVEKISSVFVDINNAVADFAVSAAAAVGELIGDLASGGDAWNNFGQAAVAAFADMAISIGRIAMATGAAALAIDKLAINPVSAIAAGAALVALGAAAKAAMSNVANRNGYAADTTVASSTYATSPTITGVERSITIDVTGTLKAEGSELVAVLNNEAYRKNHTT